MAKKENWKIIYDSYNPEEEPLREALCTLGNGYFATRGAFEGASADDIHYPGTYLAGGYNRLHSEVSGRIIENEDLVNWPNWLTLKFRIGDDPWFNIDDVKIETYRQELDLRCGILERSLIFTDVKGNKSELISRRIVHMENEHLGAIQWILKPLNYSSNIKIRSGVDGGVINSGVERYRALAGRHFKISEKSRLCREGIFLNTQARTQQTFMAQAIRTRVFIDNKPAVVHREIVEMEEFIAEDFEFVAIENQEIRLEKVMSIFTSKDHSIANPVIEAEKGIERTDDFNALIKSHKIAWDDLWKRCDTIIEVNGDHQLLLRLHIFHLLQTTSYNTTNLDVGVPARGWHGEAYRGHIFWDELFIFPFLNHSVPEITRALLRYRYRRLNEARHAAREGGYQGAMFPWQSGSDGREESQVVHLNPKSGRWIPDHTYLQRHVNAAIAFNVWHYFQVSHDQEFLSFFGAKMIWEIARFWASKATYNTEKGKYEILHVVGPDEYHTQYPDSDSKGINNNAYTNIMAVWTLMRALDLCDILDHGTRIQLMAKLQMEENEFEKWDKISRNMFVPFVNDKVISQFEGFEDLKELDWDKYHKKYGEVLRLDRILESEGDSVNKYKAAKQADVLMLFYLLSSDVLIEIFDRLGYTFEAEYIPENIDYYAERTSHGSTLSKLVFSWVTARSHRTESWENFEFALQSDFKDIQGGTTPEGIHLGAMAGTVDMVQRCYTGIEIKKDAILFNPHLPDQLGRINFKLRYRGHWLELDMTRNRIKLKSNGGAASCITIYIYDDKIILEPDKEIEHEYQK